MKHSAAMLIVTASVCLSTTPLPFFSYECSLIDHVERRGRRGPSIVTSAAFAVLKLMAEGRTRDASPDAEVKVGLEPGAKLRGPEFAGSHVVPCPRALRVIGRLGSPDALAYLQHLKKTDIEPDPSGQVWSSGTDRTALREAQLNRIPEGRARVRFLEDTTIDTRSAAARWAVEELCDRGSRESLPFIIQHLTRVYSLAREVDGALKFCEARIDLISRDPDRIKALGSFLSVHSVGDPELFGWAINTLRDMKSARAEAEVERFADEIEDLPDAARLSKQHCGASGCRLGEWVPRGEKMRRRSGNDRYGT